MAKPLPKYPTVNITQAFIDSLKPVDKRDMNAVVMAYLEEKYPPLLGNKGVNRWGASNNVVCGDSDEGRTVFFKVSPNPTRVVRPLKARLYPKKK